jgi:AraC-binding-like domain
MLALSRHPLVHTRSLEEARHLYSSSATPVRAEKSDRAEPFEWRANMAVVGPLAIFSQSFTCGLRARAEPSLDRFVLSLPVRGRAEYTSATGSFPVIGHDAGSISSPSDAPAFRMDAGFSSVEVVILPGAMEVALATLLGRSPREPLSRWGQGSQGTQTWFFSSQ